MVIDCMNRKRNLFIMNEATPKWTVHRFDGSFTILRADLWNCPWQGWSLCGWAWRRCRPSCHGPWRSPGRPRPCLSLRGAGRIAWRWPCRALGPSQPLRCCPCGWSRLRRRTTSWGTTHSHSPPSTGGSSALLDVWRLLASCVQRWARKTQLVRRTSRMRNRRFHITTSKHCVFWSKWWWKWKSFQHWRAAKVQSQVKSVVSVLYG